jgi:hypothetical protein
VISGIVLVVGVSVIGVIAAWLDYTFADSGDGQNYIAALTTHYKLQGELGDSLPSIIKWHGLVRSSIFLLIGVVFVFVLEALRRVWRELQQSAFVAEELG